MASLPSGHPTQRCPKTVVGPAPALWPPRRLLSALWGRVRASRPLRLPGKRRDALVGALARSETRWDQAGELTRDNAPVVGGGRHDRSRPLMDLTRSRPGHGVRHTDVRINWYWMTRVTSRGEERPWASCSTTDISSGQALSRAADFDRRLQPKEKGVWSSHFTDSFPPSF
jgi:hypothetical protein